MERTVLVPYDDSAPSRAALEYALTEHPDARIAILHVIEFRGRYAESGTFPHGWTVMREDVEEAAEELLAEARSRACEAGAEPSTATAIGSPARRIVEYVEEHPVDHVVMGSHGRSGVSRLLLGSVAERVVRRSPAPVTVVRGTRVRRARSAVEVE